MNLLNKGIRCLSYKHGQQIKEFFISNGYKFGWNGDATGAVYYIADGDFYVRFYDIDKELPQHIQLIDVDYEEQEFKIGEQIEVSQDNKKWSLRTCVGYLNGNTPLTCYGNSLKGHVFISWPHYRKYKKPIDFKPEVEALIKRIEENGQKVSDYIQ